MSHEERLVMLGLIIEAFEDFLEERGIDSPNDEKKDDPDASLIYGSDYFGLETEIEKILVSYGLLKDERRTTHGNSEKTYYNLESNDP